jgi:hypothetical protein
MNSGTRNNGITRTEENISRILSMSLPLLRIPLIKTQRYIRYSELESNVNSLATPDFIL